MAIFENSIGEKFDDQKPNTLHWAMIHNDGKIEYMTMPNCKIFKEYWTRPLILPEGKMENNWYGRAAMSSTKGGAMVLAAAFIESDEGAHIRSILEKRGDSEATSE